MRRGFLAGHIGIGGVRGVLAAPADARGSEGPMPPVLGARGACPALGGAWPLGRRVAVQMWGKNVLNSAKFLWRTARMNRCS
jgi:hypothetical protein